MATLTPEIAKDLMWRSMTTGAPTSEFNKYGGYDAVNALYASQGGGYGFDEMTPDFLDQVDDIIANTGIGNLAVLEKTGTPLTGAGLEYVQNTLRSANLPDSFLQDRGIPYEGFLPKIKSPLVSAGSLSGGAGSGAGAGLGASAGINTNSSSAGSTGGANYSPAAFGANSGERIGAGGANYQSDLIRSLRQADNSLMSQNTGFTTYGYTPPPASKGGGVSLNAGGAFNPGVISQDVASADDVSDWNEYNTYRTNSLQAKTPYTSFEQWLAGGKASGIPEPVVQQPWMYGANDGGGA